MALIKYGHIISEARGKLNGTVFSRNTYGSYMRTKVTPANPSTPYQQSVRSALTAASQSWAALDDATRSAWNQSAVLVSRTNIFGDNVPLTGFNLYTKLYCNARSINKTPNSNPTPVGTVTGLTALSLTWSGTPKELKVVFAPTPVPADHVLVIRASGPLSVGRTFAGTALRQVAVVAAAVASPYNAQAEYVARFGAPVEGYRVHVEAYLISDQTYYSSLPLRTSIVID